MERAQNPHGPRYVISCRTRTAEVAFRGTEHSTAYGKHRVHNGGHEHGVHVAHGGLDAVFWSASGFYTLK